MFNTIVLYDASVNLNPPYPDVENDIYLGEFDLGYKALGVDMLYVLPTISSISTPVTYVPSMAVQGYSSIDGVNWRTLEGGPFLSSILVSAPQPHGLEQLAPPPVTSHLTFYSSNPFYARSLKLYVHGHS